jgi:hypothetical protein
MGCVEGSGVPVLYKGSKVPKGLHLTEYRTNFSCYISVNPS